MVQSGFGTDAPAAFVIVKEEADDRAKLVARDHLDQTHPQDMITVLYLQTSVQYCTTATEMNSLCSTGTVPVSTSIHTRTVLDKYIEISIRYPTCCID